MPATPLTSIPRPESPRSYYLPNDGGHIHKLIREAAQLLQNATYLYCEGHYAHSNARDIPAGHPLCRALAALQDLDKETSRHANTMHWPPLFAPHQPTDAAKNRWVGTEGPAGADNETVTRSDLLSRIEAVQIAGS